MIRRYPLGSHYTPNIIATPNITLTHMHLWVFIDHFGILLSSAFNRWLHHAVSACFIIIRAANRDEQTHHLAAVCSVLGCASHHQRSVMWYWFQQREAAQSATSNAMHSGLNTSGLTKELRFSLAIDAHLSIIGITGNQTQSRSTLGLFFIIQIAVSKLRQCCM